jgi:DNA recombination protein RmuC
MDSQAVLFSYEIYLIIIAAALFLILCILVFLIYKTSLLSKLLFMNEKNEQRIEDLEERIVLETKNSLQFLLQEGRENREEMTTHLLNFSQQTEQKHSSQQSALFQRFDAFVAQLERIAKGNEERLESIRSVVDSKLHTLREENTAQLEKIRVTVDEKLQSTLQQRIGDSFKLVQERLEQVHKGLGEMHGLANGIGDLKKVLTNVKSRGTWGEVQLQALLEDILIPDQYERNVKTNPGYNGYVEFAIKLPGHAEGIGAHKCIWLPIDSKFPIEDYEKVLQAFDQGDKELFESTSKQLETKVKSFAKDISKNYIAPPYTTDFSIMFVPSESIYAEVLRRPGFLESIQREYRVVISGPSTLSALINSLQIGFKTLAIEKRTSEVWSLLSTVKSEFGKFGDMLDKVKKNLEQATSSIESASTKSRTIEKKLQKVQELPEVEEILKISCE